MSRSSLSLFHLLIVCALLIPTSTVQAQGCCPEGYEGNWTAQFFNNRDLLGAAVLTRVDQKIDFDWGAGQPDPAVAFDNFSVRWSRRIHLNAGFYNFVATSDDGVRIYVDDRLVINQWREMQGQTTVQGVFIPGGFHDIKVEYFEGLGAARIKFYWDFLRPGWLGEYWNNTSQSDPQSASVDGPNYVSFTEDTSWPPSGVARDNFSARFSKQEWFEAGRYTFRAENDGGGLMLWIDGALLINQFNDNANKGIMTTSATLTRGAHDIRLDFFHTTGTAKINFWWDADPLLADFTTLYFNNPNFLGGPGGVRSEIAPVFNSDSYSPGYVNHNDFSIRWMKNAYFPAGTYRFMGIADDGLQFIVDNVHVLDRLDSQANLFHQSHNVTLSAGNHLVVINYVERGDKAYSKAWWGPVPDTGQPSLADDSVGNLIRSGSANDWIAQATGFNGGSYLLKQGVAASAEWHPLLVQDGTFDVAVYVPSGATATSATYIIDHAGRQDRVTINQAANQNRWVSLGVFQFDANGLETISANSAAGFVGVDAVKVGTGEPSGTITSGTVATITTTTTSSSASVGSHVHVVQSGDTMSSIARKYGVLLSALIAANPTINPNLIYVGQTIVIP